MIAAGIVTFNPNISRLKENYKKYISDVDRLYVFDNGSKNIADIQILLKNEEKALLITENMNKGIAHALNVIMQQAKDEGITWVLTMDQDSVCQDNILKMLIPFCKDDVGIVHPYCIERGGTRRVIESKNQVEYSDFCITSASLTNVMAWEKSGKFDEWMFIDIVDFEFCAKLRENGYKIVQVNEAILLQEIGNLKEIKIGKRHIYVRNHSAERKYFFARNLIYCFYKHPNIFKLKIMINWLVTTYLKILLFEEYKLKKIRYMNKGVIDATKKIELIKRQNKYE